MLNDWDRRFHGREPVAHRLRLAFPGRWVRFHSLPDAKRYAEDEAETAELLRRHNRVLGALARPGERAVRLITAGSDAPRPAPATGATHWRTVAMHDLDPHFAPPFYWHVAAAEVEWRPGVFDGLIREAAAWRAVNVMVVAADCRWLAHPYDGGLDVIAESRPARDALRAAFAGWLSPLASGL